MHLHILCVILSLVQRLGNNAIGQKIKTCVKDIFSIYRSVTPAAMDSKLVSKTDENKALFSSGFIAYIKG